MNKYFDLIVKGLLAGISFVLGLSICVMTIYAFNSNAKNTAGTGEIKTSNLPTLIQSGSSQIIQDTVQMITGNPNITLLQKFSTCSTTDKKQLYYECDRSLSACSTVGAYCGGGIVAGTVGGSLIISALSDEGKFVWGNDYGDGHAVTSCNAKGVSGFYGWVLPNINELGILYTNKFVIGNFTHGKYRSSTEQNFEQATSKDFDTSSDSMQAKNTANDVRCIRKI